MKAMNTVNYFLVAEDAIRGNDGSLTIFKIFNRLSTEKVPVVKPKITLAFGFFPPQGSEKDGIIKVKLEVICPMGMTVAEITATGKRVKPKATDGLEQELTSFVDLSDGLVLPDFGVYKIRLSCDGTLLAENRFEVGKP